MNFLPTAKTFLLAAALLCAAALPAQRWERVYNEYPIEGETSAGILNTPDGGFLLLCTRGKDNTSPLVSYLMKVDEDGAVQWKHDLILGNSVKLAQLNNGNLVALTHRRPAPGLEHTYFYTVCTPTGAVIKQDSVHATDMTGIKATFLAPILTGIDAGGFMIAAKGTLPGPFRTAFLRIYTATGEAKNTFPVYQTNQDSLTIRCLAQDPNGQYFGVGHNEYAVQEDNDGVFFRMDQNGHMEPTWVKIWGNTGQAPHEADKFHDIAPAADGNFFVLNLRNADLGPVLDTLQLLKIDLAGNQIFRKNISTQISNVDFVGLDRTKILPLPDGGAVLLFENYNPDTYGEDFALEKVDASGNRVWHRQFGREKRYDESPFDFVAAPGGYALCGFFSDNLFNTNSDYLVRTDANGTTGTNYIGGKIFQDLNQNCQPDAGEAALGGWMLRLERPGKPAFNTISDAAGNYALPTDTGFSLVRIMPPANYWLPCQTTGQTTFTAEFDSATVNFGVKSLFSCPQLEVEMAAPFVRRCFRSQYSVSYANRGTLPAANASVHVLLDPELQFISASAPWTWAGGNEFVFDLGNLPVGAVGNFQVNFKVSCAAPLGQTHCSEAHIFPDISCVAPPGWSGANVTVDGTCSAATVDFSVKNTGTGPLTQAVDYIIIEDEIIALQGQIFNLPPGGVQDTIIKVPANGDTWRIETSQEPGNPINGTPSAAVEGCGVDSLGGQSFGYVTLFPNDDGNPYVSEDCQENIGSFDPNDKSALPKGVGNQHFIEPGTPLNYLIRFQNTGSDTAFVVVVRDTLSPWLDLHSVEPGPSSHPYRFEVLGQNILKFSFLNINLLDSTANEPASHGFVKFRVKPLANVPLKSVIRNRAAIFFDMNPAILTNETWHTVDTGFLEHATISTGEPTRPGGVLPLRIFPNPVSASAVVLVQVPDFQLVDDAVLRLRTSAGQLVLEKKLVGGRCEISGLPGGLLFVEIWGAGRLVAGGKLICR